MFSEQCQWAERALMSPGSSIFIDSVQTVAKAVIKKSLAYLGHSHQKLEFWAQLPSLQTTEKGWHSQRVWTWRPCPSSAPLYEGQREWDHHKDSSNKCPGQWCTGCSLGKVCHQPFTCRPEHNWSSRVTETSAMTRPFLQPPPGSHVPASRGEQKISAGGLCTLQLTSFRRWSMLLIEFHGLKVFLRILDLESSQPWASVIPATRAGSGKYGC